MFLSDRPSQAHHCVFLRSASKLTAVYELQAIKGGFDCSVQRGILEATLSVVQRWVVQVTD